MNTAALDGSRNDLLQSKLLAYFESSKPELTFLSALTAGWAYTLASGERFSLTSLLIVVAANVLVGGGAGAFNMFVERNEDKLMKRTEKRPLPSERLTPSAVLVFGIVVSAAGLGLLYFLIDPLPAGLGLLTILLYVFVYTPLKRRTWMNTLVGAVPGALPTLIGWFAGSKVMSLEAWMLFTVLFIWQMPHFLSLAWMYRKDYARAGFKMLAVIDGESAPRTSAHIGTFSFLVLPVLGAFYYFGLSGWFFLAGGGVLAILMCIPASRMIVAAAKTPVVQSEITANARRVFFGSIVALPVLMALLLVDRFVL